MGAAKKKKKKKKEKKNKEKKKKKKTIRVPWWCHGSDSALSLVWSGNCYLPRVRPKPTRTIKTE